MAAGISVILIGISITVSAAIFVLDGGGQRS